MYYRGSAAAIIVYDITKEVFFLFIYLFSFTLFFNFVQKYVFVIQTDIAIFFFRVVPICFLFLKEKTLHFNYHQRCNLMHLPMYSFVYYEMFPQESFQTLKNWVKELRQHGPPNIVVAIAGNKCDLSDARWTFALNNSSCLGINHHYYS